MMLLHGASWAMPEKPRELLACAVIGEQFHHGPIPRCRAQMTLRRQANTDVIEDLARRTAAPVELIKDLYDDEVTKLKADATVESYIPVIASQRVKRKLRTRRRR